MTVTTDFVRMMAAYNSEMNRRLYDAAARLDDDARRQDRGAFWRSIHGTLAHLIWGDRQWMSRFDAWPANATRLPDSGLPELPFDALRAERERIDRGVEDWAARVDPAWLAGDFTWWSGAAQRELSKPLAVLVPHFFNHQTHHRGQVHAMLTATGQQTGDTDLMLIV